MKKWWIGQVVKVSGVPASTIRYYESAGLLPRPQRIHGRRCYDDRVLLLLAAIKTAKRAGFTMREIRTFLREFPEGVSPSARWKAMAHQKLKELDVAIARMESMKALLRAGLRCRCQDLSLCDLLPAFAPAGMGDRPTKDR